MENVVEMHLGLVQQISDECQISLVYMQLMKSNFLKLPLYLKFNIKLQTLQLRQHNSLWGSSSTTYPEGIISANGPSWNQWHQQNRQLQ